MAVEPKHFPLVRFHCVLDQRCANESRQCSMMHRSIAKTAVVHFRRQVTFLLTTSFVVRECVVFRVHHPIRNTILGPLLFWTYCGPAQRGEEEEQNRDRHTLCAPI